MVSRKDVAKLANVSPASVSYYINNSGYVSKEAGERIQKAIDKLGYVPNQTASALRSQSRKQFVFLCNEIRNPFYSQLVYSSTKEAASLGYGILFSPIIDDEEYLRKILGYQVCGVFASNSHLSPKLVDNLVKRKVPVVLLKDVDQKDIPSEINFIQIDVSTIFSEIKNHLIDNGYKNPCYLSSSSELLGTDNKTTAFLNEYPEGKVLFNINNADKAYLRIMEAFDRDSLPDSIICANDAVAFGAKKAITDLGASIPEDCALIGFDNTYNSQFATPAITSVGYEEEDIGKLVINMLIDKDQGKDVQNRILASKLFIRKSSAR